MRMIDEPQSELTQNFARWDAIDDDAMPIAVKRLVMELKIDPLEDRLSQNSYPRHRPGT